MKLFILLLVLFLSACVAPPANNSTNIQVVARVVDGDSLALVSGEQVRLLGIDAPERGEHFYKESKARLTELVMANKEITLEADKTNKDRYGRLLRHLWINGTHINLIMVKEGYAYSYILEPNVKYKTELIQAEKASRLSGIGIWLK